MRIVVLVKQVPNTTKVKLDPKTGNLIREGIEAIINPEDRHALEAAVQLKEAGLGRARGEGGAEEEDAQGKGGAEQEEAQGKGGAEQEEAQGKGEAEQEEAQGKGAAEEGEARITALTMGPPQAIDVLTEALACGADRAVLLTDKLFAGADTWATSTVLARAIEKVGGADLVLAGRQAIDGDTAQIGPQVAEALGLSQATYVEAIEASPEPGWLIVSRKLERGRRERLRLRLPALLTVVGELNRPRYPRLGGLLAACEAGAPVRVYDAADLGFKADEVGLAGSMTEVVRTFSPKGGRQAEMLAGKGPSEMAEALIARLSEAQVFASCGIHRGASAVPPGGQR